MARVARLHGWGEGRVRGLLLSVGCLWACISLLFVCLLLCCDTGDGYDESDDSDGGIGDGDDYDENNGNDGGDNRDDTDDNNWKNEDDDNIKSSNNLDVFFYTKTKQLGPFINKPRRKTQTKLTECITSKHGRRVHDSHDEANDQDCMDVGQPAEDVARDREDHSAQGKHAFATVPEDKINNKMIMIVISEKVQINHYYDNDNYYNDN